jgi:glycosyltransferase involved in cell wall biosynthesis
VNPRLLIHRLPSIVDATRFAAGLPSENKNSTVPQFVYCGTWLKDVFFVIQAFNFVKDDGYPCQLKIVGAWAEHNETSILKDAKRRGLSPEDVVFTGCVDERTLEASYKNATALLAPLWDDDRSRTRLPNKLGEYLASGTPVVAGRVGDLTEFLTDDVNACLAEPGNERDFADKMIAVLQNPRRAGLIGAAGQQACIDYLDYRAHVNTLAKFFKECLDTRRS